MAFDPFVHIDLSGKSGNVEWSKDDLDAISNATDLFEKSVQLRRLRDMAKGVRQVDFLYRVLDKAVEDKEGGKEGDKKLVKKVCEFIDANYAKSDPVHQKMMEYLKNKSDSK
jgi:hypothetical protein